MPRYFRRVWDESRGDEWDGWGVATYFFEASDAGAVFRQVEVYTNGRVLRYGPQHAEDEYGFLTDQPLDLDELAGSESDAPTFETAWNLPDGGPRRRRRPFRS